MFPSIVLDIICGYAIHTATPVEVEIKNCKIIGPADQEGSKMWLIVQRSYKQTGNGNMWKWGILDLATSNAETRFVHRSDCRNDYSLCPITRNIVYVHEKQLYQLSQDGRVSAMKDDYIPPYDFPMIRSNPMPRNGLYHPDPTVRRLILAVKTKYNCISRKLTVATNDASVKIYFAPPESSVLYLINNDIKFAVTLIPPWLESTPIWQPVVSADARWIAIRYYFDTDKGENLNEINLYAADSCSDRVFRLIHSRKSYPHRFQNMWFSPDCTNFMYTLRVTEPATRVLVRIALQYPTHNWFA